MSFNSNIKILLAFLASFLFLSSCGFIGKEKVEANEQAVLSGPPLAIPPEFDINQSASTNDQETLTTYDNTSLETNNENIQINDFESNVINNNDTDFISEIENTNEIQNFETFEGFSRKRIKVQTNLKTNNKVQRLKRSSVPSDAYNFSALPLSDEKLYVQKKEENFFGRGPVNFEQSSIKNNKDLSKDEEFLLDDIIKNEAVDMQDYQIKGDSD